MVMEIYLRISKNDKVGMIDNTLFIFKIELNIPLHRDSSTDRKYPALSHSKIGRIPERAEIP
jgi:hypothetical protein